MKTQKQRAAEVILALLAASTSALAIEAAPGIRAPEGQVLLASVHAEGFQVYECKAGNTGPQWTFKAPEAELMEHGRKVGTHYAGPTWESEDGSKVMAAVAASAPSAGTIPHLLLKRKDGAGSGRFEKVAYVVRRDTVGGLAPAEPCNAAALTRVARSPYQATYDFYGDAAR